jgi:hypothetical protein
MRRRCALCVVRLAWLRGATVLVLTVMVVGRAVPATAQVAAPPPQATRNHAAGRPDLFIEVPLDQYTPDVVFPFGGSHHQVPGVVAVNHAPYYCVPHQRAFRERADFVVHLRTRHGLTDDEIRRVVLVVRGQVRYVGN